jgi:integral membrane protein
MLEAISFLVLLGIAMPLKYIYDLPQAVRVVGMAHGLLFIAYVYLILYVGIAQKLSFKAIVISILGSVVPFGPIYVDWKYLKPLSNKLEE